ncbi:tetratricopeptide repeat protein [Altibacter lentus]|uniref:tetratricopeptide repeat protein n=1 Tax=Altibacter lentus TaxID=1223410 RepID=UPI0005521650|nr:tetratricopeptide repeat protein [Altibacter lentus]
MVLRIGILFSYIVLLIQGSVYSQQESKAICDSLISKGVKLMQEGDHVRSLELLVKAQTMARENNWHNQRFLAYNNMGANYYSMHDLGEALDHYLQAYTIAIKELGEKYEMIVLNNIAVLYLKEDNFDKALEYFSRAFTIANKNADTTKIAYYAVNLGLVANQKHELDKARSYFDIAIPLLKDKPDMLQKAYLGRAENMMQEGQYISAKEMLEKLAKLTGKTQQDTKLYALNLLSELSLETQNNAEAIQYAKDMLLESDDVESQLMAYEQLAKIYKQDNQLEQALIAKDSVLMATQRLHNIKNGRLFETGKVRFEIQNYRNQLQDQRQRLRDERNVFIIFLALAVIIILLFIWALRINYTKGQQRKVLHARNEELMSLALEKERLDRSLLEKKLKEEEVRALLEEERLQNEIETRNRKLSAKALHLLERNEMLSRLVHELEDSHGAQQQTKLKAYIRKLKGIIKTDNEWEQFIKHFEEVNQGFLSSVKEKHPPLNSNDLRFISYVYMNLSTKEIASVLNITDSACRKRKERISRKMNLQDSSQLYDYLSAF